MHDYRVFKPLEKLHTALKENTNLSDLEIENFWNCNDHLNLLICQENNEFDDFLKNLVIEIIENISLNGPLCGEKLTELKIVISALNIANIDEPTAFTELSAMFYDAIKKALNEAELILMEPIYHTIIQLPPDYIKNAVSLLTKYSAKIKEINQENDYQAIIEILLPVRHSIKFAEEIRSATSGRAFWQNEFFAFLEVPSHEAANLINDLRFLKGLSW